MVINSMIKPMQLNDVHQALGWADKSVWSPLAKKRLIESILGYSNVIVRWFTKSTNEFWHCKSIELSTQQLIDAKEILQWENLNWEPLHWNNYVRRANANSTTMEMHLIDWDPEGSEQLEQNYQDIAGSCMCIRLHKVRLRSGRHLSVKLKERMDASVAVWHFQIEQGAQVSIEKSSANKELDAFHVSANLDSNARLEVLFRAVANSGSVITHSVDLNIQKDAQNASIDQTVKVLHLGGMVFTRPWLRIDHDQVKASHGIAIGGLDQKAMKYLTSRGVSKEQAQAFLIEAHLR